MSVLVCIPYHVSDNKYFLDYTIKGIKNADILVATDYDAPTLSFPIRNIKQTRVPGRGIGKAINACATYFLKNKYDCLIIIDGHMVVPDNLLTLCKSNMGTAKVYIAEFKKKLFGGYTLEEKRNSFTLSSFLDKNTWDWYYVDETKSRKTVMTTEPCISANRKVVEDLLSIQGVLTTSYYWGKEKFDFTISAARLGYHIDIYPEVEIGHVYKVGSPSWSSRFKESARNCKGDPFCGHVDGSAYEVAIRWGDCAFSLKHYGRFIEKTDKQICNAFLKYDIDVQNRIKIFNEYAKYSLDDVYKKLNEYMKGAHYYKPG